MTLVDSAQRIQATDPFSSFIVQAPAGSGKTEILTQRYLRLLSTVQAPEQIIALTFTRKAASEMRERIVLALQQAAAKRPALSTHQQMTLDFAQQALECSERYQWNLLQQPNRLKIITIDSLCQSINQAIPLMEKQIAYSNITDKPESHYLNAARACIQFALDTPEYHHAISTLLLHVDNRRDRLLALFKDLLAQRDQWLKPLFQARTQEKAVFEQALRFIEQHELVRLQQSLPLGLATDLVQLAREMACLEEDLNSPRQKLKEWYEFKDINQEMAIALSKLLLTGDKQFRNAFDHHVGLKKGICSEEEYQSIKSRSKKLLAELHESVDFLNALLQVSSLPTPEYDVEQWEVLQALFVLLPLLVGHLHLIFSEHNEIDFTAISQQALQALGEADNPTDLALYLDHRIHHLLVDEFQDTSISQFELLSQLVQGWQAGDGKTLFVVGDPMQSIYRFRQAEVGLFFRAKEQGIGGHQLQSLELRCNFRSSETIVQWVNQHFSQIFPKQFDMESGAVSFHSSVNVIKGDAQSGIQAWEFKNKEQEALHLIDLVKEELARDKEQSLAILVRSRSQLAEIIRLLRQQQIPYQGTDIDLLANLLHLRDAWSLTQALLLPANRLAWLAVLRSPYCGLSLPDIYHIAAYNTKKSIYAALLNLEQIPHLSNEGRHRALYFTQVMQSALNLRYQSRLSEWVGQTLKELHVEQILNPGQLSDLEQFWSLLDRYELDGRLPDLQEFQNELHKLYSQQATPSRLQVMTIHKSKGLEFDTVFLPGLGAQPNRGDQPMLRWLKLPSAKEDLLLVSPIQAAHQEACALYDYLSDIDREKSSYEAQRVLYVAVTRAKSRLYLLDSSSKSSKGSFRALLKHQNFLAKETADNSEDKPLPLPQLTHLPNHFYPADARLTTTFVNPPSSHLSTGVPRLLGIVAHQLLQWICEHHPQTVMQIPWELARTAYKNMGFNEVAQSQALEILQEQVSQLFRDPIGSWIIAAHEKEWNEYELLVSQQHKMVTRIIDRCFVDQGKLWIIDFKTGKEDEHSLKLYQQQLNEYATYLSSRFSLPIYCGLYYLQEQHWVSWEYGGHLHV
ncbi:MAG: ATP-dependent DNA helicase [Legionella sp.]|nr:MAG: ATP-dependent DNA helicase [Legionella sp.]